MIFTIIGKRNSCKLGEKWWFSLILVKTEWLKLGSRFEWFRLRLIEIIISNKSEHGLIFLNYFCIKMRTWNAVKWTKMTKIRHNQHFPLICSSFSSLRAWISHWLCISISWILWRNFGSKTKALSIFLCVATSIHF